VGQGRRRNYAWRPLSCAHLRDERGIETAEWLIITALVAAIALLVYSSGGPLATGLQTAVCTIVITMAPSVTCP
jgi:hypothetical protein